MEIVQNVCKLFTKQDIFGGSKEMGKKGWNGKVFVLISLILLLVFGLGLGGMTYIDTYAIQKEMEEKIAKVDKKCKELIREFESGENDIEEMFYFSQEMENIYDVIRGEKIGFYGKIERDTGETIYENGDKVFYHIYEKYKDEEGDTVFAETEQKILKLSDYLKSKEIEEIARLYRGQEEAALAIEGYMNGVYIVPTKIEVLGNSMDADYEEGKYPIWEDKNGNHFYAQVGDNVEYYVRKTYEFDVEKGNMESFIQNAVLECEFSFLWENEEDDKIIELRAECQKFLKNPDNIEKMGIQKIQMKKEVSLKGTGNHMMYTFVVYPLQISIDHLKVVYIFAAIIYVLVCYVIYMVIHTNIRKQQMINKNQKMLTRAIAHELKTPLSIIQGYCEGIQNQKSEEKKKEYMNIIIEESKEMNELVLDMLELSKLENQSYILDIEEIELVELTHAVLQQYESFMEEKQLQVEFYGEDSLLIEGDLSGMRKVISNLISNGMKHTPVGGVIRITFCYYKKKPEIRFFNNGSRIEENIRKHIWEGYYQSNENNGKMLRSSGLGLTIVGHILKLHHWKYGCENLEEGVEFWIRER